MSLFEQQLAIIREFDNGNYNTKIYKDFLNNSKNYKDYNRNFSMLLELIIIKILSDTKIEDIKNVFRLYLDLFIKNCENKIEQTYNKSPNKFSNMYRMKNIKANHYISTINIMNDKNKLKNNNEIEIGIIESPYYDKKFSSINVNNIETLNNIDLDNLYISICIYDYDYNKINSILNTYIENENVKELKNILLNDDLDKFIEFINKNKIIILCDTDKIDSINNIIYGDYRYSLPYNCVLFSAVKCFMYLFVNNYITDYEKLVKALSISGNIPIFKLMYKYLSGYYLNNLINNITRYHKNDLFEYILNNHYEDVLKSYESDLYLSLMNSYNFDILLELINKGYDNNKNDDVYPNYKSCYIITYIYDNFGYCITKHIDDVLYDVLYEDLTISEYKELLYNLPLEKDLNFNKLIFRCFKYNKSAEFIKELIKECEITNSNCYYFNEPLRLLCNLITHNKYYKFTFVKDTFEKVFSDIQISKTCCYYYVSRIINKCFKNRLSIKDINNIVNYIKQGKTLKNREANKLKPVSMLWYLICLKDFGQTPDFKEYEEMYLNKVIPYDVDEMKSFISIFQYRYITNDDREELLKLYKKYVNCLTFKE